MCKYIVNYIIVGGLKSSAIFNGNINSSADMLEVLAKRAIVKQIGSHDLLEYTIRLLY
jgi:hypothetical protein